MSRLNPMFFILLTICFFSLGIILTIAFPEYTLVSQIFNGLGIILFLFSLFLYRTKIINGLRSKRGRFIWGHIIQFFLITFIVGLLNYISYKNDYFFDLTLNKLHTLSDQSKNIVSSIDAKDVEISLFASRKDWGKYRGLLHLYSRENEDLEIEFFDIDRELGLVALHDIQENGTLVVKYKEKEWKTVASSELAVTTLFSKIFSPEKKKIYYSVGHNEISFKDETDAGASFLYKRLEEQHWQLESTELMYEVPEDADGLLLLNPQIDFLPIEVAHLRKYLDRGGSLFIAMSPRFSEIELSEFDHFISEIGLKFKNIIVLDRLAAQQGSQASIPVVSHFLEHKITQEFNKRVLFPISATFELDNIFYRYEVLAKSIPFPGSWGETSFSELKSGKAKYNEGDDLKGGLPLLVAGENTKSSRILALSSTIFFSNQFKGQSNNVNLLLNGFSWLIRDEIKVSLSRPNIDGNIIYISEMQANIVFYFTIIILPFLFFFFAIYKYKKRLIK